MFESSSPSRHVGNLGFVSLLCHPAVLTDTTGTSLPVDITYANYRDGLAVVFEGRTMDRSQLV